MRWISHIRLLWPPKRKDSSCLNTYPIYRTRILNCKLRNQRVIAAWPYRFKRQQATCFKTLFLERFLITFLSCIKVLSSVHEHITLATRTTHGLLVFCATLNWSKWKGNIDADARQDVKVGPVHGRWLRCCCGGSCCCCWGRLCSLRSC